jgi:ABC-type transport system involved in cytochrome bd biosynthesis fused ATPase/permease subunit
MSPTARIDEQDAPLLLLKKATSSLDGESRTLVRTVLEQLMRRRTTLVIPHRLATRLSRDRIPVKSSNKASTQTSLPRTGYTPRGLGCGWSTLDRPTPRRGRS